MRRREILIAGGALVGATLTSGRLAAADYTVRLAHSLSATEPAHLAAEFFAKNVTERSDGNVQVSVFPGEQLGTGKSVNEMIRQGSPVMNLIDPGYLSDYVPDVGVLNGPYLLESYRDYDKILASDWLEEQDAKLQQAGFRVIAWNCLFGPRHNDRRQADPHTRRCPGNDRPRTAKPDVDRDLRVHGRASDRCGMGGSLQRARPERRRGD